MEGRTELLGTVGELLRSRTPVGLLGEPGIGTTSLLRAAAAELPPARHGGGLRSLHDVPWLALNRALAVDVARDPAGLGELLLEQVGDGVLVIDDLQWADRATLDELPRIAAHVRLLVGIRRGDPGDLAARRALAAAGGVLVPVEPLEPGDCERLVRRVLPEAAGQDVDRLVRDCAGNPAVLGQLVADGRVGGALAAALGERVQACSAEQLRGIALLALSGDGLPAGALGDGLDAELVAEGYAEARSGRLHLRHRLVGAAAVDHLTGEQRTELHRLLAGLTDEIGQRAEHLLAAGAPEEAQPLALEAAATASGERRAQLLELAARCVGGPRRAELLAAAADAALQRHDLHDAHRLVRDAMQAVGTTPTDAPPAVLATATELHARLGARQPTLEMAAHLEGADHEHHVRGTAATAFVLAWPCWQPGEASDQLQQLDGAAPTPFLAETAALVGLVAGEPGWEQRLDALGPTGRAFGSLLAARADDLPIAEGAREPMATMLALHTTGDSDGVAARLGALIARDELVPHAELAQTHLALALCDSGRSTAAAEVASRGLSSDPSPAGQALLIWALIEAETIAGRLTRARSAFERLDRTVPSPAVSLATVAAAWAAATAPDGPAPLPSDVPTPWAGLQGADLELAALGRRCDGADHDVVEESFLAAARAWSGLHRRGELRCRWAAADAALASDRRDDAIERLRELEQVARRLGQRPLVARVRGSLRAAGIRSRPARGDGRGPLSAREVEVLELVRLGFTSGEAARALGVAPSTVDTQVESAMRKLGARTRLQAAALVAELAS